MNGRERFTAVMQYRSADRLPRFEEGIREEVQAQWEKEGLPVDVDLDELFEYDVREEVEFNLEPFPKLNSFPVSAAEMAEYPSHLNPDDAVRGLENFVERAAGWQNRTYPLILRVQRGFFLSMGVENWQHFQDIIALTKDDPHLVARVLQLQGDLSAQLAERFLAKVSVEAALFSEPIGGNHGPLISPRMYRDLIVPSYRPVIEVLKKHGVEIIIARTYANPKPLIPILLEAGINCLWAVEAPPEEMDYLQLRSCFGKDLRLIGGIDTDALRSGREAIREAVKRLEPLAAEGGFIPLLDGRVREDVRYSDYLFYRERLVELTGQANELFC